MCKSLNYDACCSYSSYLSLDYASGHQKTVSLDKDSGCSRSEAFCFPSTYYGFKPESQCLKKRNLNLNKSDSGAASPKQSIRSDGNASWSSDDFVFRLPDGVSVACSLNLRESGHEKLPPILNGADKTVHSSCRGHFLEKEKTSFSLQNIYIDKFTLSGSSSPRVNISPSKLNWGENYLYHSSIASLSLKNACNESKLEVYEPFSTDSQFYPFNFSEVVLGPGEVTSISFVYVPNKLGSSSAELILQTSLGGFLVEAKGSSVDSPYGLRVLLGFDAPSGEWLSRKLSLSNPFDETIDLKEVTSLISVYESSGSFLVESICRKQNPKDFNKHRFSSVDKVSNGDSEQLDSFIMGVRPLNSWYIGPHRSQSILEMAFSIDSEQKVVGAICMELFRPLEGKNDMLVVPFEAELNKSAAWKDTTSSLSVSITTVGPCDASEATISVSVRNRASHLLKIVKINEVVGSKQLLQTKYLEGLLLFPGTVSLVALVKYESSNFEYDSILGIPAVSTSCKLEILVNDSISPLLEVPCLEIFAVCPRRQRESFSNMQDIIDISNRTRFPTKALIGAEADEFVREGWRAQKTMSGVYLLDNHELLFPLVPVGNYHAKSITVRNPSQQPVIVQLILNSGEIIDNCKTYYGHQQSPFSGSLIYNDSARAIRCGFSVADSAVTEAFLHPLGTASLGPIFFHPSNRCEWKTLAFIRSNLSGLELLSLRGFGGSLSLVVLEDSELVERLDFNMHIPLNTSNSEDAVSACRKPLLKKLFAVNVGDFPVIVKRIDVSGRECGLDGFVVHNCQGFSLEPGESFELGLSYQSDLSMPVVLRELELILTVGILVIPMQAIVPPSLLNLCKISIIWSGVKRYCSGIVFAAILFSLFWFAMSSVSMGFIRREEKSIPESPSTLPLNQGNQKGIRPTKTGIMKQGIVAEHTNRFGDCQTEVMPSPEPTDRSVGNTGKLEIVQPVCLTVKTRKEKKRRSRKRNALVEFCSSQSGNSTPSSPLSPITTLSPPETCSLSLEKIQGHDSVSPEPLASPRVPENQSQTVFSTKEESPDGSRKTGSRVMLLPSATFPGSRNSPSRLAMAPHARAPGPKFLPQKAVQPEDKARAEDRFTYSIWGNHLSGLHLYKPNSSITITSEAIGHSNSFFLRGPQQTLMTNSQPPSVSSSCDEG